MSNDVVQAHWKTHWKNNKEIDESGTYIGRVMRRECLKVLQKNMNRFSSSDSILDVGCGGATTLALFKSMGFRNVTGIDFADEALARCEQAGFVIGKDVFQADATHTHFPSRCFDVVFSDGLLEHFVDPRPHMLEMARLSRRYIVLIQPNHFSFFGRLMVIGWNIFSKDKGGVKEYSFLLSYFSDFLKTCGFRLVVLDFPFLKSLSVMVFERVN